MKLKKLRLENYRGFSDAEFELGDFTCLIGPNGIGKTSVLEAISLLCSSLEFDDEKRLASYLSRNIPDGGPRRFLVEGEFERDGEKLSVVLGEQGFQVNELLDKDWWWMGVSYFARFDSEMTHFQLGYDKWPDFKHHFEAITGFRVEPETCVETELQLITRDSEIVTGFVVDKGRRGKVHCRRCSAGEKKIAKTLSQIVNIEESRRPFIALVDNMEMHVHYKRHMRMFDYLRELFQGIQIVATTHSTVIMTAPGFKDLIIDLEEMV